MAAEWIFLLLALWAALLFWGFIYGDEWPERARKMPRWTRMASSFTLVVFGWAVWLVSGQHALVLPFAIGMTLGFVGDLFMAHIIPVKDNVLGGMGSFGLGHIAYIVGLVGFGQTLNLTVPHWGALIFWWVVAVVIWYVLIFRGGNPPTILHYAALPYGLLLASTAGFATGLALQSSSFIPLAIGAALFLISDLILGARLFNKTFFYLIDDVVWLTYGPGQMLILVGCVFTLPLLF